MSSSGRDGGNGRSLGDFSTLSPMPRIVAPLSASTFNNSVGWEEPAASSSSGPGMQPEGTGRTNGLDYVQQYLEEERVKISKIKLGNPGTDQRNGFTGRGRAGIRRGRGGRGRGNANQGASNDNGRVPFNRHNIGPEKSIYGTIPDQPVADHEVFLKYDFNQRAYDTTQLVINRARGQILTKLTNHQVMTVEGFTGCGKTTQVPQFILDEACANQKNCRIAVTQPRRIAAISVATRVAAERRWTLGGIVGYQVGMDKKISEDTRLTYMTTGVLLQLLISRKSLGEWTHIIIDEVHERDLETDLLLLVIKKIMVDTANDKTKVILMSATLNPEKFTRYFPSWDNGTVRGTASNIKVDLPNQFPVKELFLEDAASIAGFENYSMDSFEEPKIFQECFEIATKIVESLDILESNTRDEEVKPQDPSVPLPRGAVLIFLPGLLEIETLYKIMTEVSGSKPADKALRWNVLPLHSSITNEEQQRVFVTAKPGIRKIILATNIAESSITVPDIRYVIDFCLTKNLSCDPTTNYTCLRLEWASKNQCIQRRGRCGRVAPGTVYRMVSKKFYDTLEQEARPEMLRSSLESVVLQVKLLDMGSPKSVLALSVDPPDEANIKRAVSNLKEIGALTIQVKNNYDAYDGDLTFVGRVLSRLPIDIRLGRLILLGHAFDCLEEAVIIAAGLSVKSPFAYPYSRRLDAYLSKLSWSSKSFSDCVTLFNLYSNWFRRHQSRDFKGFSDEKQWSKTYFVQLTSLREMKVLVDELYKRLRMCGIELAPTVKSGEEQLLILKLVIAGAFYPNYFVRSRPNAKDYHKEIARDVVGKDPFCSVTFQGFPLEQPGDLYKKIIGKKVIFQNCIPHMEFHGSRVVVTFDSRGSVIGPISAAVYRAVKQRQLRQIITFGIPSRDVAYKILNDRKMHLETIDWVPSVAQAPMPGLRTTTIQAVVTHIESPSEFFVVQQTDEIAAKEMTEKLHSLSRFMSPVFRAKVQISQLCVTMCRGQYFRARVDAERNRFEDIMVYLIDRGISIWVHHTHVYAMSKEILEAGVHLVPAMAIQCRLKEVRPALYTDSVWCAEALTLFDSYCSQNNCHVVLEIYAIARCVISATLKNSIEPGCESVNDILIQRKYAEKCDEPQAFRDNAVIRERMKFDVRPDVVSNLNTFEKQQNNAELPEVVFDPPLMGQEPDQEVSLRGPHSPLEMTFTSLCGSAHLKQVVTDGSSINSVALDQDPSVPASRLLIAANVAIAQRSGNIMARETTMMPPIPGLTGLMAMLFCPKVEFRVDEHCTMYTGCLTGLGMDPTTYESVYSDHDMEVVFDTVLDNEDVGRINAIRSAMNTVLSDKIDIVEMRNLRDRMRREALVLLTRTRKSMEEIWPEQTHHWTPPTKEVELLASEAKSESAREACAVFPLHKPIKFQELPEGTESSPVQYNRNIYYMFS